MKKLWVENGDTVVAENSSGEKRRFPRSFSDACEWLGVDSDDAMDRLDENEEAVWLDN